MDAHSSSYHCHCALKKLKVLSSSSSMNSRTKVKTFYITHINNVCIFISLNTVNIFIFRHFKLQYNFYKHFVWVMRTRFNACVVVNGLHCQALSWLFLLNKLFLSKLYQQYEQEFTLYETKIKLYMCIIQQKQ